MYWTKCCLNFMEYEKENELLYVYVFFEFDRIAPNRLQMITHSTVRQIPAAHKKEMIEVHMDLRHEHACAAAEVGPGSDLRNILM
jgi:hypothetical protein